jgi:membrane protease YdiL (CAAX protease family)
MIGAALLSTMILATLVGFFICWPAAMVYRFFSGRMPPGAPPENAPWSVSDVLRVAAYRLATGRFLPWTPRRQVPWTFIDVVVVIFVAMSLLVGIATAMQGLRVAPANGPVIQLRQHHVSAMADSAWKLSAMALAMLYLIAKSRVTWRDFGLSWPDLGRQLLIGLFAFVMLAPPVYAIQAAIVWFGKWKYEHPLIEMLQKSPDIWLFLLLAFSACIMAPLSEEWFFRAILQGWLERAFGWLTRSFSFQQSAPPTVAADSPATVFEGSISGAGFAAVTSPAAGELPPHPAALLDPNPYAASHPAPSLQPAGRRRFASSRSAEYPRPVAADRSRRPLWPGTLWAWPGADPAHRAGHRAGLPLPADAQHRAGDGGPRAVQFGQHAAVLRLHVRAQTAAAVTATRSRCGSAA